MELGGTVGFQSFPASMGEIPEAEEYPQEGIFIFCKLHYLPL